MWQRDSHCCIRFCGRWWPHGGWLILLRLSRWETPEGDKRSMMQLDVDEVGASLQFANVTVKKMTRSRAEAIVKATTFYDDPDVLAKVSRGLGEAMVGITVAEIPQPHRLAERGW